MKILGLLLVLAGAATFLPKVGVTLPTALDPVLKYQPWAGIGAVVLGLILIAMAPKKGAAKK